MQQPAQAHHAHRFQAQRLAVRARGDTEDVVNRLVARRMRGEEGASLMLAMAFIVLFALMLTALLAFATTSFQSQATVNKLGHAADSAAAGIDTAIARVRNDPQMLLGG